MNALLTGQVCASTALGQGISIRVDTDRVEPPFDSQGMFGGTHRHFSLFR
jgi:hypothetical protein